MNRYQQLLTKSKELWVKSRCIGALARDGRGVEVSPASSEAVSFCARGAIMRASLDLGYGDCTLMGFEEVAAVRALNGECNGNMAAANDGGDLTEAVWDAAIEWVKDWRP